MLITGWALLGAMIGAVAAIAMQSGDVAADWARVAHAEGSAYWRALGWFGLDTLFPLLVLILIAGGLFGLVAGAAGVIVALLPRRIGTLADGVALAATVMTLMQMLGISASVRTLPGGWVIDLAAIWFAMIALSDVIWNRVSFGLTYRRRARRRIALPMQMVRDRLQPFRAPNLPLADAAVGGHDDDMPASWQPVLTRRDGPDAFRVDEASDNLPYRRMRYALSEPGLGETLVEIEVELRSLSPLAWWDMATRPYAEDFLDHLEARLLDKPDRSTYGMLAAKQRKAARRKAKRGTGPALRAEARRA